MQHKATIALLALILAAVWSLPVLATSAPRYKGIDPNRAGAPERLAGGPDEGMDDILSGRTFGAPVFVGAAPAASPGLRVGETTYDYQHNSSTGRQVDEFGGLMQVTWMKGTTFSLGLGRTIYWNKASVVGSPAPVSLDNGGTASVLPLGNIGSTDGQPAITGGVRPGYTTFRNLPTGRGVAFMHDAPEEGPGSYWLASVDASIGVGVFIQNPAPQPEDVTLGQEMIWPHSCVDVVGSETVLHVIATEFNVTTDQKFYYWRGVLSGTAVTWSTPVFMDSVSVTSQVIEANPTNDDVTIVYSKPRTIGTQVDNDVVYRRSTNGGLDWGPVVNTTNYTDDSLNRSYTDLDAVYDEDGTMHVLYCALDYRPGDGTYWQPADLIHWDDLSNNHRLILTAEWENSCAQAEPDRGGVFNLQVAKPSIAVKPAGAGPGTGFPEELLYAAWVQFGPTDVDCATTDSLGTLGGYVNGEIWYSVSSNDGLTWDRPQNVTGTVTPDCLPGDCHSEHWVSAAAQADSGFYISYTDDSHAGGIPQDEGVWSTSPYRIMALEARFPVLEPRIGVTPQNFIELNVDTVGSSTALVTVNNLGNAALTFEVAVTNDDGGASHVLVNGGGSYSNSIAAAGAPDVLSIEVDGLGLPNPSEHNWRLEVTSNDAANDPGQGGSPIDINLNVFVANPWYTCVQDTISTGERRLAVGSCLEVGDQGSGGGLYGYADSSEWVYDATPVLTRLDGSTKLAHRDIFYDNILDRTRSLNQAYRAQGDITVDRNTTIISGENSYVADVASGVATTTDSLIQIDWEVTTYKEAGLTDGAVMKYVLTNRTATTFTGLGLAAAADLDLDSVSSENDGIASDTEEYVGAQGGFYDTSGTIFTPLNNFAAIFHIALDTACSDPGTGGQVLDNEDYVYIENGYNSDSLYDVVARTTGWNAATFQADTITDVNAVMVSRLGETLGPNDTVTYAFGLAVSDVDQNDLEATIGALRIALNPGCFSDCPITLTGDVNLSTTVTAADIIYLVGFVFKGGPAPQPCTASGDVNCSGTVTAADIIYLVGFVFKGGPAPCDACTVIDSYPDC